MRVAIVLTLLAAGVLGYGWWHVRTHAWLHMSLTAKTTGDPYGKVLNAEVTFLDVSGNLLARGKTDGKFGVVLVEHPVAGYCGPDLAQTAYAPCFAALSSWLPTWAGEVRLVNVTAGACQLRRAPVQVSVSADNVFLWWVPLPHIGGKPYTNYNVHLEYDPATCAVVAR